MSGIRELSFDEVALVNGGSRNGQSNDERNNFGRSDHSSRSTRGVPVTTANNAGIGIIAGTLGALAAIGTGPVGMVISGAIVGGLGSAMPSSSSGNKNSGGGWHDTKPGRISGQCRW